MNNRNLLFFLGLFLYLLLYPPTTLRAAPQTLTSRHPLPNVTAQMEKPEFWIKKIQNPDRLLLKTEEIEQLNRNNLNRKDLYLFNLNDIKEELSRDEILALLREDWQGFGTPSEVRYGKTGSPLGKPFWEGLKTNLNQEYLKENNKVLFGLIVKRTNIRVFPTEEESRATPGQEPFDQFQHSSLSMGSLVRIYHISRDNRWAYVQTQFVRGWVQTEALAIASERNDALEYQDPRARLVVTGSFISVFGDPPLRHVVSLAQMGDSFPILSRPHQEGNAAPVYIIRIPVRETSGELVLGKGSLPKNHDIHEGFLPYTQANLARQAFKMLHEPYGWGEMSGARDCSRFIMDIFASFGIVMPRNSMFQGKMGKDLGATDPREMKQKMGVLDKAVPFATVLRLPGHIMLYLGKDRGRYYAIHNIWGIQKGSVANHSLEKIGKVEVTDLSLGESGPYGSLLQRITDIRFIGINGNFP
jgi:cell wall-associated NlpC family hydrolase